MRLAVPARRLPALADRLRLLRRLARCLPARSPGLGRRRIHRQTRRLGCGDEDNLQIVFRREPHAFEVLPRRWVVERTFAWISKHRRTTRDYEHLPASHEAMILWAMIALMTRRLAPSAQ